MQTKAALARHRVPPAKVQRATFADTNALGQLVQPRGIRFGVHDSLLPRSTRING
jgi:hypothetical protein